MRMYISKCLIYAQVISQNEPRAQMYKMQTTTLNL